MTNRMFLGAIAVLTAVAVHASPAYVQRTMRKMAESTSEKPATVRMLFYGQSIVEQGWGEQLTVLLKKRYPTVNFVSVNKAIGGFTSELLIRTAEADLYPEYADIVFFQDYGPTELVRTMIERLRARTTSEIVIWTGHVHRSEAKKATLEELARETDPRSLDLISIAKDNHCLLVHLRRAWCEKLLANGWTADHYLNKDGVHLNRESGAFDFYAETIEKELVRIDGAAPDPLAGTITDYPMRWTLGESPACTKNADGSVDFAFTGNRVEMRFRARPSYGTSPCTVLLDGKPLSAHKELFHHGRASNLISWMPFLLHVGADTLPVEETWKLTFTEGTTTNGPLICYRVDGSRTGFDGEGRSDRDFVSKSGRVTIKASDFHLWQYAYFVNNKGRHELDPKPGQWIQWRTLADFTETFDGYQQWDDPVLVLSGCTNGPHKLTFVPSVPARLPVVEKLTVYRPAGKEVGETAAEAKAAKSRAPVNPDFDLTKKAK